MRQKLMSLINIDKKNNYHIANYPKKILPNKCIYCNINIITSGITFIILIHILEVPDAMTTHA